MGTVYLLYEVYFDGDQTSVDVLGAWKDFEEPAMMCIRKNAADIAGLTKRWQKRHQLYYGSGFPPYYQLGVTVLHDD